MGDAKVAVASFAVAAWFGGSRSDEYTEERECIGNLETYYRRVIKADVRYKMWFSIKGRTAVVRVAGREFNADVDYGDSWKGPWLKEMDDLKYLSYLPEEGHA